MMDDFMDMEIDKLLKQKNISMVLGTGNVSYMLLAFALACKMNIDVAATLFLASYAIGMMGSLTAKMPSGLYGYQESILTFFLGVYFFGLYEMLSSIFIIISIQLWDDFLDYKIDLSLKRNWAYILGRGECLLLACIFCLSAIYIDWFKTIISIMSMHMIVYITHIWLSRFEVI